MSRSSKDNNKSPRNIFPDPQDILMNAPVGVFTSTPDGSFLSVNPAMAELLGYASPEGEHYPFVRARLAFSCVTNL
jgi:PAS domain-containing protein